MNEKKSFLGRLVLVAVLLAIVGGLGWAGYYVVKRGQRREGLLDKAMAALRRNDDKAAEARLREVLKAHPGSWPAHAFLCELMMRHGRFKEALEILDQAKKTKGGEENAWRYEAEIALDLGNANAAIRTAQANIDLDPVAAQTISMYAQDLQGSLLDQLNAIGTAENLARTADDGAVKASALLFAGETHLFLAPGYPDDARAAVERAARSELSRALAAVQGAQQLHQGENLDLLAARIQVLSDNESVAKTNAKLLSHALQNHPGDPDLIASLVSYHILRKDWDEAKQGIAALAPSSSHWVWSVRHLAAEGKRDLALQIFDALPKNAESVFAKNLHASLLLGGTQEQKKQGAKLVAELVSRNGYQTGSVIHAYAVLARHGQLEEAIQLLETAQAKNKDIKLTSFLAAALNRSGGENEKESQLLSELAGQVKSFQESAQVMGVLAIADRKSVDAFFERVIAKGGPLASENRVLRAAVHTRWAAYSKDKSEAKRLNASAVADIDAIVADPHATKTALLNAATLDIQRGRYEQAGLLTCRAEGMPGWPYNESRVLLNLARDSLTPEQAAAVAKGVRAAAAGGAPKAFSEVLAQGIESRMAHPEKLLRALEPVREDAESKVPALWLDFSLAAEQKDIGRAESDVRALKDAVPEKQIVRDLLGGIYLSQRKWEDTRRLHTEIENGDLTAYHQLVLALFNLGRKDDALEKARKALEENKDRPEAYLMLASLYEQLGKDSEALSLLSVAPDSPGVRMEKGKLLEKAGDVSAAETVYWTLIGQDPLNIQAWGLLQKAMLGNNEAQELSDCMGRQLRNPKLPKPMRVILLIGRGDALSATGDDAGAQACYEEAVRIGPDPQTVAALNNVAWYLAKAHADDPASLKRADDYIHRALKCQPERPELRDTCAAVLFAMGKKEEALKEIDFALDLARRHNLPRKPSWLLRRAKICLALGKREKARLDLEEITRLHSKDKHYTEAAGLLKSLKK